MRWLVVGDIHGCWSELQDLLDKAGLGRKDAVVGIGDLVDRGPDPARVLGFFRDHPQATSLQGNHEYRHAQVARGERPAGPAQVITRRQLGEAEYERACAFMGTLPRVLDLPDAWLVHGFFEPGLGLRRQKVGVVLGLPGAREAVERRLDRPWYQAYDGRKPLVVGHRDYTQTGKPLVWRDRVFAIDTGCVYGRALTGLLLPEFRLVSVRSRADHWSRTKKQRQPRPVRTLTPA